MMWVLLFVSILHVVHCSCPDGFELVARGECRGYAATMQLTYNVAANTAVSKCKEHKSEPVIIHDYEQQSYWAGKWTSGTVLPIGLVCNTSSTQWQWADGSTVLFRPPGHDKVLDEPCDSTGTWYIYNTPEAWYYSTSTSSYSFAIFCTAELPHLPVPSDDGCYAFEDDTDDGVCYQVGAAAENWQDAQLTCRQMGANLASIHNLNENAFVRRMAVSKGAVSGLFLGATSGKGTDFGWVDGSQWDYQNWCPGYPMKNSGDCLAMDTSNSSGQWINTDCSAKLPVACVRDIKPLIEIPEPTCATGPYEEGTLITSPGFPYNASVPCDFLLTVDEGKRIEVEITYLEANSCCDFVTLYNDFIGGSMIANLTGELRNGIYTSTFNNMRVSWQPNGGVNVMGLAMTFRGV